jgi:hypothetical protein
MQSRVHAGRCLRSAERPAVSSCHPLSADADGGASNAPLPAHGDHSFEQEPEAAYVSSKAARAVSSGRNIRWGHTSLATGTKSYFR